jgi:hypothetical protein
MTKNDLCGFMFLIAGQFVCWIGYLPVAWIIGTVISFVGAVLISMPMLDTRPKK